MKIRYILLAAALALLLAGCRAEEPVGTTSVSPEPSPTASEPVSAPPEELTPEELLAEQPMDDTHDAFLVDTGGRLGTLLVTAEKGERIPESELGSFAVTLSVWNPRDMEAPLQTMETEVEDWCFGRHETVDANFDGHMDFSVLSVMGNQPNYWYLWVWDEEAGQFTEVPEYAEISGPRCNPETEVIDGWARNSGGGDGLTTFHRWEDGELVCIRRIETGYDHENMVMINEEHHLPSWIRVEDRIDGELTQVYYRYYSVDEGTDFFPEREKWRNLDYRGEE